VIWDPAARIQGDSSAVAINPKALKKLPVIRDDDLGISDKRLGPARVAYYPLDNLHGFVSAVAIGG
jgi:hypothetical protein